MPKVTQGEWDVFQMAWFPEFVPSNISPKE